MVKRKQVRVKSMSELVARFGTQADCADKLGVAVRTIRNYLKSDVPVNKRFHFERRCNIRGFVLPKDFIQNGFGE